MAEHRDVLVAITTGDPDLAGRRMLDHLAGTTDDLVQISPGR
ncbi:hypothetical protein [Actinoplanes couchii]